MRKIVQKACTIMLCGAMAFVMSKPVINEISNSCVEVYAGQGYDDEFTYGGRTYHYNNNGDDLTLVYVSGSGELTVPSSVKINGKERKITSLEYPFANMQNFSKITIPDTVTKIGKDVFINSTIGTIVLSKNLTEIGNGFCRESSVNEIKCESKKIKSIGTGACNKMSKKVVVISDWLVKYEPSDNTLDLSTQELSKVNYAVNNVFNFDKEVNTLKISKNEALLKKQYFKNNSNENIANIYIYNGTKYEKVECTTASGTVPDVLKRHYELFDWSYFSYNYAKQKAKLLLNSMGFTYYGDNSFFFKGTLSPSREYQIALKVHDYIVNQYIYDADKADKYNYLRVFNCNAETKCGHDAEIYALLLESAGVEAECVYSEELIPADGTTKANTSYTPDGKYEIGYWGEHEWNAIRIGDSWYYVDTTNDRCNSFYTLFLFSNQSIENGGWIWEGGVNKIHRYPHFTQFPEDNHRQFLKFQNQVPNTVPPCYRTNGDIDKNDYLYSNPIYEVGGYITKEQAMLNAYIMLPRSIRDKYENNNGVIEIIPPDVKIMNNSVLYRKDDKYKFYPYYVKLVEKRTEYYGYNLLFDYKNMDLNFDGKIDMADSIELEYRLGSPFKKK